MGMSLCGTYAHLDIVTVDDNFQPNIRLSHANFLCPVLSQTDAKQQWTNMFSWGGNEGYKSLRCMLFSRVDYVDWILYVLHALRSMFMAQNVHILWGNFFEKIAQATEQRLKVT